MITKNLLKNVPISDLIPYENNPRSNDLAVKEVAESIREFGYVKIGVIVDENKVLLAGHTTLKAMKFLGWDKVPEVTQVTGLTEAQKIAYRIADNKTAEVAKWDFEKLETEVKKLADMEYKLDLTGFSQEQLSKMFEIKPEPKTDKKIPMAKEGAGNIYYKDKTGVLYCGNALTVLKGLPDGSVDLVVTDPPYGLEFMGKDWDKAIPDIAIWAETFRILKAGSFAFIMSSPRQDVLYRMIQNLEMAGFNCGFTSIYWAYATGFPKSSNMAKEMDKRLGFDGKIIDLPDKQKSALVWGDNYEDRKEVEFTEPMTYAAKQLDGSYAGYQPKPAVEIIIVAMKPLNTNTFLDQADNDGKGVTWLDDCRIGTEGGTKRSHQVEFPKKENGKEDRSQHWARTGHTVEASDKDGRFPANLIVSDEILDDGQERTSTKTKSIGGFGVAENAFESSQHPNKEDQLVSYERGYNDSGGFSRYFSLDAWWENQLEKLPEKIKKTFPFLLVPKPTKKERDIGCEDIEPKRWAEELTDVDLPQSRNKTERKNYHPTVKPIKLFSYLTILGSREGDVVLDLYMGSGTLGMAAKLNKRKWIGIELLEEYAEISKSRISAIKGE